MDICPRCKRILKPETCLIQSRADDLTRICLNCSTEEALNRRTMLGNGANLEQVQASLLATLHHTEHPATSFYGTTDESCQITDEEIKLAVGKLPIDGNYSIFTHSNNKYKWHLCRNGISIAKFINKEESQLATDLFGIAAKMIEMYRKNDEKYGKD